MFQGSGFHLDDSGGFGTGQAANTNNFYSYFHGSGELEIILLQLLPRVE
jgi:hypothetical protein